MFIKYVKSRLGCLGLPVAANSPLNSMGIYTVFDRASLPRIGDLPNCLHTDLKFQNQTIQSCLLEPRGVKYDSAVGDRELHLSSVYATTCVYYTISAPSTNPDTWWPKFWDGPLCPQSTFPTPSNPWPEMHTDQIGSPSRTLMFLSPKIPFHGLLTKPPLLTYWLLPLILGQKPLLSQLRSVTPAIGSTLFHHLP